MRRFAWILGIVAVLALIGTTATAIVVGQQGSDASVGSRQFRDRGLAVTLPAPHWTLGGGLGFRDDHKRVKVAITRSGLYRHGFCAADPELTRAFVGIQARDGKHRSARAIAHRWAWWASYDTVADRHLGYRDLPAADSAGSAERADVVATYPSGPCNPPRVRITVVTHGDSALVLMRDLAVRDALPDDEAERIVASLRPVG